MFFPALATDYFVFPIFLNKNDSM